MAPEDFVILGVAAVVVANRVYTATRLHEWLLAYPLLQALNIGMIAGLTFIRLGALPPRAEAVVRLFLSLFVAWHMVLAFQCQQRLRSERSFGSRGQGAAEEASEPSTEESEAPEASRT